MNHFATPNFWFCYRQLDEEVRQLADRCFQLLKADSTHRSLRFKKVGNFWVVRVGLRYRAMAKERLEGLAWFWIGSHDEYEELLKQAY